LFKKTLNTMDVTYEELLGQGTPILKSFHAGKRITTHKECCFCVHSV